MEPRICLVMLRSAGFIFCCSAVTAPLLASPWLVLELSGAGCWSCCGAPAIKETLKNSVAPRSDRHLAIFDARCIFDLLFDPLSAPACSAWGAPKKYAATLMRPD